MADRDHSDTETVDELGIPIRLHYFLVAAYVSITGLAPFAMSFGPHGEPLANPGVRVMAGVAVVAGPLLALYGHRTGYRWQKRTYHVAAGFGLLLLSFAAMHTGSLRGTLIASMIVPALVVSYFLPPLHAMPHALLGGASITATAAYSHEPNGGLHAVVMGFVVIAGSLLVMMIKRQVVNALAANRRFSETDALTGAANLHRLETRLADDLERFARSGEGFALIELDLDEFKEVNDRYSHTVGDQALIMAAEAMRAETTPLDLVVRRGGDEFLIVAAMVDDRDIDDLIRRVGDAIVAARSAICDDIMPTASIAYVTPSPGDSADDLIRRADDALHEVKAASHASRPARAAGDQAPSRPFGDSSVSEARRKQTLRWSGKRGDASHDGVPRDPIHAATAFAWRGAAILVAAGCATIVLPGVFGIAEVPISAVPIALIVIANFVVAPVLWLMSTRNSQSMTMSLVLVFGTIVLLAVAGVATPGIALPTVDLLLLVAFVQTYLLPGRLAAIGGLTMISVYVGFLLNFHDPEPVMRAGVTISAAATISSLLATARRRTVELAAQNEAMARTDALSGIPNLRRLRDRLTDEIRRCEQTGESIVLLMIDLDDFKSVNDLHSHSVGDRVIVAVADAIEASVRGSDMPARRGGDEFAVVLTDTNAHRTAETAARVAAAIESARLAVCPDVTPSVSVGSAKWRSGETVDGLIARADENLHEYRATIRHTRGASARAAVERSGSAS